MNTGYAGKGSGMIKVTRLNGKELYINASLVLMIEATPNTVITFTNDVKLVVKEAPDMIIVRVAEFQARVIRLSTEQG